MNTNSFILHKDLLPVTIKSLNNETSYYFEQFIEDYILRFLETEMPGSIIGDIDEEIISVLNDHGVLKGYIGEFNSEYYEKSDSEISIGTIKEIFTTEDQYEFYLKIFKYRESFSINIVQELGIMTLENIFYEQFKALGFEKVRITTCDTYDGYNESTVIFKNIEGKEINVFYPEYDYCEGNDWITLYQGISFDWCDFLKAIKSGNIMNYKAISE